MLISKISLSALAMFAVASPAFAQEACGGGNADWIGGSEAASDISAADEYQEQMALVLEGNAYFSSFALSQPATVRIEVAGRGGGDPMVVLSDDTGATLNEDDDSGGGVDARIEAALDAGTYCVEARAYDGTAMTAFVRIGREEHEPLTTGMINGGGAGGEGVMGACFDENAQMIALGETGSGSAKDVPHYTFTLTEDTPVTITANNSEADPMITIYDANNAYLAENDDFDGLNSKINMSQALVAGDYCVEVSALSDETVPITVAVTEYDEEAELRGMYDRAEASPPMDGSYPIEDLGTVENRIRVDGSTGTTASWYQINVQQSGVLVIEAVSANGQGDPALKLYDDFGREVAFNDDGPDGLDPFLAARVNPGDYLVALYEVGETGGTTRMMIERYVPVK